MKKEIVFSLMLLASAAVAQVKADDVVKTFSLAEAGALTTMLAEAGNDADSVVVSGPMDGSDMKALRHYCTDAHVRGVDISKAVLANDSLPSRAFGWMGIDNPVENITLPEHLRAIGPYAFYFMGNLKHVEFPATLEKIGYSAFVCCLSLRNVSLPEGLREIQSEAFANSGLEELTIPQSVTTLRYGILANCYSLKALSFLAQVDEVPSSMCLLCTELENVSLPDGIKTIGSGAFDGAGLKTIQWPAALETIESDAFSDTQMEEIVLPSHVTKIDQEAFNYSSALRSMTLPASLQTIDQSALQNCPLLEAVYCLAVVPPTTTGTKDAPQAVLYVPEESVEAYRADAWWGQFKEIRGFTPTAIDAISAGALRGSKRLYRVDGTRAGSTQRGLYIKDGRKFVIR